MMPSPRAMIANVLRPVMKALEGAPRPGPYNLPLTGGWLPDGAPVNWWQTGISLSGGERSAIVTACVNAYAETRAMCPGSHWRSNDRGGRDRVTNSALSRVLRRPNSYQTTNDFLLNATRSLYLHGNCFALATRNSRFEVDQLHLMDPRQSAPAVTEDGDVFYRLGGNDVIDRQLAGQQIIVPQRDTLHVRLHCDRRSPRPLVGESPIVSAYGDLLIYENIRNQQQQFYANMARPSCVLSTDMVLDRDQVQNLRDRWNEQAKGLHQGGVPILTGGLRVTPWVSAAPAKDLQTAELLKLTQEQVALAFRVPLAILGISGGQTFVSTEALLNHWLSTGLGFAINHLEQAFDKLFGLEGEPDSYCEFNTDALLRSDRKDRIEALARGVQAGIYSPNDARAMEDLDAVPYGDEPRTQAQNVPLSAASSIPSAPSAPAQPAVEAEAAKMYQRDLEALRMRAKRPDRAAAIDGAAQSRGPIIHKTKQNGLQPRTFVRKTRINGLQR